MALHSAQGPKLGVPQLIQSRGQFGFHGALLAVLLAVILYVGFWAFTAIPAAQSLNQLYPDVSIQTGVIIVGIPSIIIAILGYKAIHVTQRYTTWLVAIALVALTLAVASQGIPTMTTADFSVGPFLLAVGIIAVYQAGFAPYVSDYSRYLPEDVGMRLTFLHSYSGTVLGAIWAMGLGAILTAQFPDLSTVAATAEVTTGVVQWFVLVAVAIGALGINAMNLYGGMLALITGYSSIRKPPSGATIRIVGVAIIAALSLWLSMAASDEFIASYQNFLLLLVYTFVPWTAINLTDYYIIRKGAYDIPAFFEPKGRYYHHPASWTYAGFNLKALIAYFVGIAAEVPFINVAWWKGWAVDSLQGADISWVFGLFVAAGVYYLLARSERVTNSTPASVSVTTTTGAPTA
jgi:NCS1 family nucleobase:cation symporter-1